MPTSKKRKKVVDREKSKAARYQRMRQEGRLELKRIRERTARLYEEQYRR